MSLALMTDNEILALMSKRIKSLRIQENMKQTELAKRSGVPLGTVRAMERTGYISLKHFVMLLRSLGQIDDLDIFTKQPEITDLKAYAKTTKERLRVKK